MKNVSHTHERHLARRPPVPLLRQESTHAVSCIRVSQEQRDGVAEVLVVRDGGGEALQEPGGARAGGATDCEVPSRRPGGRGGDERVLPRALGGGREGSPRGGRGGGGEGRRLSTPASSSGLGSAAERRDSLKTLHSQILAASQQFQGSQLEGREGRDKVMALISHSRRISAAIQQLRSEEVLHMDPQVETLKDLQRRMRTPRRRRREAPLDHSLLHEGKGGGGGDAAGGGRAGFGPEGSYAYEPSFQYMLQEDSSEGPHRASRSGSTFRKEESFGFQSTEDVVALAPREFKFAAPRVPARDIPNSPKAPTRLHASVVPNVVELRGSGFRKYRSQPQPKWKDHARLLREVQSEVEAELGEALSQARRRKAIELTLHRYMSGAIDADADADMAGGGLL